MRRRKTVIIISRIDTAGVCFIVQQERLPEHVESCQYPVTQVTTGLPKVFRGIFTTHYNFRIMPTERIVTQRSMLAGTQFRE